MVAFVGLDLVLRRHRGRLGGGILAAAFLSVSAQGQKRSADQNGAGHHNPAQTHAIPLATPRFPGADGVSILRPSH